MSRFLSNEKLAILVLLTASLDLSTLVAGSEGGEELKILHYDEYLRKFDNAKAISGANSKSDFQVRMERFFSRTFEIFEHNMLFLKKEVSYHLEQNQFIDMGYDELKSMFLTAEDLAPDDQKVADDGKQWVKFPHEHQTAKRNTLDFKRDFGRKKSDGIGHFLNLLKDKVGNALVNEVVKLKEAFASEQNELISNQRSALDPFKALKENIDKMRAPLLSMLESAKGAFWEYLKDEGIVDVRREIRERKAEVGRARMRIDWRITNCISEPRQQSLCNSCYAMSVISLLEYYYCREKGLSKRFSPQHIIDCGKPFGLRGCHGGKLTSVGHFIEKNGLQLESDFPYSGQEGQCSLDMGKKSLELTPRFYRWEFMREDTPTHEWLLYAKSGPLLVGIGMPADFLAYGGGIHDGHNCDPNLVHAMLLIGYGIQDGKEFWLLQNSYSRDWGEDGYFRLLKNAPRECFNAVINARATFADN